MKTLVCLFSSLLTLSLWMPAASANTTRLNYQIDSSPEYSTFDSLLKQAENMAQKATDEAFRQADTTAIVINISGEQSGQIMPVLTFRVTREDWQKQPEVSIWAKYAGGAKQLLGFNRSSVKSSSVSYPASNPIRDGMTERESNFYNQR